VGSDGDEPVRGALYEVYRSCRAVLLSYIDWPYHEAQKRGADAAYEPTVASPP
jgi:hypothetical protein